MAQKHKGGPRSNEDCCSFCGAKRSDVALMFQGADGVNICNICVERGYQMLVESELVESARKKGGKKFKELSVISECTGWMKPLHHYRRLRQKPQSE